MERTPPTDKSKLFLFAPSATETKEEIMQHHVDFPKSLSVDALLLVDRSPSRYSRAITPPHAETPELVPVRCVASADAIDALLVHPLLEEIESSPLRPGADSSCELPSPALRPSDIDVSPEARHSLMVQLRNDVRQSAATYLRLKHLRRRREKEQRASERRRVIREAVLTEREREQRELADRQNERLQMAGERRRNLVESRLGKLRTTRRSPGSENIQQPNAVFELAVVEMTAGPVTGSDNRKESETVPLLQKSIDISSMPLILARTTAENDDAPHPNVDAVRLLSLLAEPCHTLRSLLEAADVASEGERMMSGSTQEQMEILHLRISNTLHDLQDVLMSDPFAPCSRCKCSAPKKRTCPANVTKRHSQCLPDAALKLLSAAKAFLSHFPDHCSETLQRFVDQEDADVRRECCRSLVMAHYALLDGMLSRSGTRNEFRLVSSLAALVRFVRNHTGSQQFASCCISDHDLERAAQQFLTLIQAWESVYSASKLTQNRRSAELISDVKATYVSMRCAEIARSRDIEKKNEEMAELEQRLLRAADDDPQDNEDDTDISSAPPQRKLTRSQCEAQLARLRGRRALQRNKREGLTKAIGAEIAKLRAQLKHLGGDAAVVDADQLVAAKSTNL